MAASANDKFIYVGNPGTATTLSAPGYTIGNPSITVGSTTNFPTLSGTIFAIDTAEVVAGEQVQVSGTYCVFSGTVTDGTTISNLTLEFGTPQNYAAGALTRVYIPISALHNKRLIDGILVSLDQDGTLKAGAVDGPTVLADNAVTTAKITDSNVTTAKIADDAVTAAKIDWATTGANGGIWWEELGRHAVSSGDTLSVTGLPIRKYLMIKAVGIPSGSINFRLRFNNDSGANYSTRYSINNGVDTGDLSSSHGLVSDTGAFPIDATYEILNIAGQVKMLKGAAIRSTNTSSGTSPERMDIYTKWVNTTDAITRIDLLNLSTGDFAAGSELIVLGHN